MDAECTYRLFVGIDIAGATFTVSWAAARNAPRTRPLTLAQTPDGFAALQSQLQTTSVAPQATLVVMEATGSYGIALGVALHQAGYAVSVVNPAHAHNDATSLPRRSKTDALDAELLTQFAAERQPARWTPPPAVYHELRQRLVARDTLMAMRQQARNHRHALRQWPVVVASVQTQLDATITDLDARIRTLEGELAQVLQDGAWAESARLLQTIPGIGMRTAAWLLVLTINVSLCRSAAAAGAYAGLVPQMAQRARVLALTGGVRLAGPHPPGRKPNDQTRVWGLTSNTISNRSGSSPAAWAGSQRSSRPPQKGPSNGAPPHLRGLPQGGGSSGPPGAS